LSTTNLPPLPTAPPSPEWKIEVSARLRAHRSGRSRVPENQPALPGMEAAPSSVAARVAQRYAKVPSWREAMAAEAAARAAAEAAKAVLPPVDQTPPLPQTAPVQQTLAAEPVAGPPPPVESPARRPKAAPVLR